jgi:hypothetical protein
MSGEFPNVEVSNSLFQITNKLKPMLLKKNTKYWRSILLEIHVISTNLHIVTTSLLVMSYFAIGKSILSLVLHEFVVALNDFSRKLISWLVGPKMHIVMEDF